MAIQQVPITLSNPVIKNVSPISGQYAEAYNVITGLDAGIYRRGGLTDWITLPSNAPIDGLYWWELKKMLIAVSGQDVYKITDQFGTYAKLTTAATQTLNKYTPIIFASGFSTSYNLLFCNGTNIFYTDGGTTYSVLTDVDAPDEVTHIAFLDLYVIANHKSTDQFFYSDVADFTTWFALDTAVASYDADNTVAVHVGDRELLFVGESSIESWYNDGVNPFSRNDAACIESGCSAAYSFTRVNNDWFWLDSNRQVVKRNGRLADPVYPTFNTDIQSFQVVSDAKGSAMQINGNWYYILNFPTEQRTFVYNVTLDRWEGEWTKWDTFDAAHENFLGKNHAFCTAWNIHAIGSREGTGKIYKYNTESGVDDTVLAYTLRASKQTGNIDFGSTQTKWGYDIILNVRRGASLYTTDPSLMVRWKNDDRQWSEWKTVSLGILGDTDSIIRLRAPGRFKKRRYEFAITDNSPLEIISAEQVVDI